MTSFKNSFSEEIWRNTFCFNNETIDENLSRVACLASKQEKINPTFWFQVYKDLLCDFKFVPAGRILANSGVDWNGVSLLNCFVGSKPEKDQDSMAGILEVLKNQVLTLKSEGGWGMNFSFIRPRGSIIKGIGVQSPGVVKFMELFDKSSEVVTEGSGLKSKDKSEKQKIRKGAMMGILDVWHPEIFEFIEAKQTPGRLTKFNISVGSYNKFMDLVVKLEETGQDSDWELIFPDTNNTKYESEWDGDIYAWIKKGYSYKIHRTVKVSELWNLLMESTYKRNDPGIFFIDRANETHCFNYSEIGKIRSTNPCGEQALPFDGVCLLGSLNLTQFISSDGSFDFNCLANSASIAVRFLDCINDVVNAPLPKYKEYAKKARRMGIGIMGWGSLLYLMKIRFASEQASKLKHEIMKTITHSAVRMSIDLAKEKGMFEWCDPKKHSEAVFWNQIDLPDSMKKEIKTHGIRNSALFSIQPTGNTGILANNVSGGCEPVFKPTYVRTSTITEASEEVMLDFAKIKSQNYEKETDLFKFSNEGSDTVLRASYHGIVYKADKNRGLTKETDCDDYAVHVLKSKNEWDPESSWVVCADDLTAEEHIKDMKEFSRWLDSACSKTITVKNDYPFEDFRKIYLEAYKSKTIKGITTYREGTMASVLSSKSNDSTYVNKKTNASKREKELDCDVFCVSFQSKNYYVVVGLVDKEPYEIFIGANETDYIPKKVKSGKIVKEKRGVYKVCSDDKEYYLKGHNDENADALGRMISTALRHGADISFVVHQLEKTKSGNLFSFSKVLARTLKKYIKNDTLVHGVEKCSICESTLFIRQEGCIVCKQCGYSKCD